MKSTFTFLLAAFCLCGLKNVCAQVNQQDSLALVDLYNSTNGPTWSLNENWLTPAPLSIWYGVTVVNNRVTQLSLPNNQLRGYLPAALGNLNALTSLRITSSNFLKGSIPSTFGNLTNLTFLSLYDNGLTGAIPSSIGNAARLQIINLSYNAFSGSVPRSFSKLKSLKQLIITNSELSGRLPSSLAGLESLTYLNLRENALSGKADFLGSLESLSQLDLTHNNFSGNLPYFSEASPVIYIYLSENNFSGSIANIGKPLKLIVLSVGSNNLSGVIPGTISNAKNLASIDLYRNKISGSIPASIGQCANLSAINFNENNLTGNIPSEIGNLQQLNTLSLEGNHLNGTLPSSLAAIDVLDYVEVENNKFTFSGMEELVASVTYFEYSPQAKIPVHLNGDVLAVSAGGTLSNNTYKWYKNGELFVTKKGDSTLQVNGNGDYTVRVINSIATKLTLKSDTVTYSAGIVLHDDSKSLLITISPNPVKDVLKIAGLPVNQKAIISIVNRSGNMLQSAICNNSIYNMNISGLYSGVYTLQINVNGRLNSVKFVKE